MKPSLEILPDKLVLSYPGGMVMVESDIYVLTKARYSALEFESNTAKVKFLQLGTGTAIRCESLLADHNLPEMRVQVMTQVHFEVETEFIDIYTWAESNFSKYLHKKEAGG